ncbi:MAG: hypothetical protein ACYSWP_18520 [Planctomycetota bacterium]|jgi:hypothetical protein
MRQKNKNKCIDFYCVAWRRILLKTVIIFVMIGSNVCFSCEVTSVYLYVDRTEVEAETSTKKNLFLCGPNTPYAFRVKWKAKESGSGGSPENGPFDIKLYQPGETYGDGTMIWSKSGIEDSDAESWQTEVNDINTSSYLVQGVNTVHAYVRRPGSGDWVSSNKCTIAIDEDPDDELCWWDTFNPDNCNHICFGTFIADNTLIPDICGDQLHVMCIEPNYTYVCHYEYYHGPNSLPLSNLIGLCVWTNGYNQFGYKKTSPASYGKRFLKTIHNTFNDLPPNDGVDPDGEACSGFYCFRCWRYNCLTGSTTKYSRRTTSTSWHKGPLYNENTTGVLSCPGPDPNTGTPLHPGWAADPD